MPRCDARQERSGKLQWRCDQPAVADRSFCEKHLAEAMARVRSGRQPAPAQRIPFVRKEVGTAW